jgi:cell division septation protein DedD
MTRKGANMAGIGYRRLILTASVLAMLAGCQEGAGPVSENPPVEGSAADAGTTAQVASATSVKLVDRDVEAPEIFQTTDQALWDGRPSLGGVWVASPEAKDPERVIMRNPANGKFVIGALFRRERDNPGPTLQISSDAAAALGLLAGEPGKISVTALRRDEAAPTAPDASKPILDAAETVDTEALDPIAGTAAAAIDKAEADAAKGGKAAAAPAAATAVAPATPGAKAPAATATKPADAKPATAAEPAATKPAATPAPANAPTAATPATASGGLIQIGIFSQEANAKRAVDTLKKSGITATIKAETSQGKPFWSVTARGDSTALSKIKQAGFKDAYYLKG